MAIFHCYVSSPEGKAWIGPDVFACLPLPWSGCKENQEPHATTRRYVWTARHGEAQRPRHATTVKPHLFIYIYIYIYFCTPDSTWALSGQIQINTEHFGIYFSDIFSSISDAAALSCPSTLAEEYPIICHGHHVSKRWCRRYSRDQKATVVHDLSS